MKKNNILKLILFIAVLITGTKIEAQISEQNLEKISFAEYLTAVSKNNLGYIAEQYNVKIAEAEVVSQKVFPDPELSIEGVHNGKFVQYDSLGYGGEIGLSYTFELGGKRKARIRLAKSEAALAKIELEMFFQDLRADATDAFLEAKKQMALYEVKSSSYKSMRQLHEMDSLRYSLGEINQNDLRQSRIEVVALYNELLAQDAECKSALIDLNRFMGLPSDAPLLSPQAHWAMGDREYNLAYLYSEALANNKDLHAAAQNDEIAANELKVVKSERWIDLELSVGFAMNSEVKNPGAEAIAFNGVTAGITIPLKFSNFNKGALKVAKYQVAKSEVERQDVLQEVKAEVNKAFFAYEAAKKQLSQYKNGIIDDSRKLLEGVTYQYQRGETSLFELLMAKRTCDEVEEQYIEALKEYSSSLVDLESICGIWNINF